MARPDPFLNLLKSIGFLPLRLPRSDVQPLQLLNVDGKDLSLLGPLTQAMRGTNAAIPPVEDDIHTAAQVQGTSSSTVKLSIGLNILGNIISALTGQNLDISAAYQHAATLKFEFDDVVISNVSIIALDKYLNSSDIDSSAKQIQDLMIAGDAAVTTAVARTKKYVVSAQDSSGSDISVNVPVIQSLAGGKLSVNTTSGNDKKLAYEGTVPVVFGIQAIRLGFSDAGHITAFTNIVPGAGALRGLDVTVRGVPNFLTLPKTFAEISGQVSKAKLTAVA